MSFKSVRRFPITLPESARRGMFDRCFRSDDQGLRCKYTKSGIKAVSNHVSSIRGQKFDILNWLIGASYKIPNPVPGILCQSHSSSSLVHLSSPMTPETYVIPRSIPSQRQGNASHSYCFPHSTISVSHRVIKLFNSNSASSCGAMGCEYR